MLRRCPSTTKPLILTKVLSTYLPSHSSSWQCRDLPVKLANPQPPICSSRRFCGSTLSCVDPIEAASTPCHLDNRSEDLLSFRSHVKVSPPGNSPLSSSRRSPLLASVIINTRPGSDPPSPTLSLTQHANEVTATPNAPDQTRLSLSTEPQELALTYLARLNQLSELLNKVKRSIEDTQVPSPLVNLNEFIPTLVGYTHTLQGLVRKEDEEWTQEMKDALYMIMQEVHTILFEICRAQQHEREWIRINYF